tara:strand:- start:55 stop:156 length:102 start_codon:yes stop_codon:yes gene_type:complete
MREDIESEAEHIAIKEKTRETEEAGAWLRPALL